MGISEMTSLVALIVAVGAFWISIKNSRNQENLSFREIEWLRIQIANANTKHSDDQKANVSARMYKHSKNSWRIKLFNKGPNDAFNVRLKLNEDSEFLSGRDIERKLPMKRMEKGESVEFNAFVHMQSPAKEDITILWHDAENKENSKTVTLTT